MSSSTKIKFMVTTFMWTSSRVYPVITGGLSCVQLRSTDVSRPKGFATQKPHKSSRQVKRYGRRLQIVCGGFLPDCSSTRLSLCDNACSTPQVCHTMPATQFYIRKG